MRNKMRNKMRNRIISLLCIIAICMSSVTPVFAQEPQNNTAGVQIQEVTQTGYYVNPLYEGIVSAEEPQKTEPFRAFSSGSEPEYVTDVEELVPTIRSAMKDREASVTVHYAQKGKFTDESFKTWLSSILEKVFAETGKADEGDFLRWQYAGWSAKHSSHFYEPETEETVYSYDITLNFTYYTTAAQNKVFEDATAQVLEELDVKNATSDYEKVKRIYDYICENVTYDNANLKDEDYTLKFTAYAALINKTAVCQGYANLFYYLAQKAGLSVRLIPGTANGGNHAWNIVKLGSTYYYLDSTWDAQNKAQGYGYEYFLKGSNNFNDHVSSPEYTNSAFTSTYPISKEDYDYAKDCKHVWNEGETTRKSTCTEKGNKRYSCTICSTIKDEEIPLADHVMGAWYIVSDATYSKEGIKEQKCNHCDHREQGVIPKYVVKELKVDKTEAEIYLGKTLQLTANCKPIQPSLGDVAWKSDNEKVAVVDASGKVTAKSEGTAVITAQIGGFTASCEITVIPGKWMKNNVGWWYQNADGTYPRNCRQTIDGKEYYFDANGYRAENKWALIDGDYYYFGGNGVKVTNRWVGSYWLGEDGVMATNAWVDGGRYYVGANGGYVKGWLYLDGWYYLGTNGVKQTGWILVGKTYYYGDPKTGKLYTNQWLNDTYYLQGSGAMATGWTIIDGSYYYFNAGGAKVTDKWIGSYYLKADGKMAKSEWVDNGRYYVDANGIYVKGWLYLDGWYYLGAGGAKQTGWIWVGGTYYYGDLKTGKLYTNRWLNDTYYLQSSGAMAIGWLMIDGDYYYFNAGGAKVTSKWIGNYYLKADGVMAKDEWIGNYYVDKSGKWIPSAKK